MGRPALKGTAMSRTEYNQRYYARKKAKLQQLVSGAIAKGEIETLPPVKGYASDLASIDEARKRKAWTDVQSAELNLLRLQGKLVAAEGIRSELANMAAMFPLLIKQAIAEALGIVPKSPAEKNRLTQKLTRDCCAKIAKELKAAAEGLADA
jgi:hypothetical protein